MHDKHFYLYIIKSNVILRAKWAQIHYLNFMSPGPKKLWCSDLLSNSFYYSWRLMSVNEYEHEYSNKGEQFNLIHVFFTIKFFAKCKPGYFNRTGKSYNFS